MKRVIIYFLFGVLVSAGAFSGIAHAQVNANLVGQVTGQLNAGATEAGYGGAINPYSVTANYIKMLLGLMGTIFFILILWGGYDYFTAKGDEEHAKNGLKIIKSAIIGLAIVLGAYSITIFIVTRSQAAIGESPVGDGAVYK